MRQRMKKYKCNACEKGVVVVKRDTSTDPHWYCKSCGERYENIHGKPHVHLPALKEIIKKL
jgi:ribosomal protein L37AE/L43A